MHCIIFANSIIRDIKLFLNIKHEYLRSRASTCVSLSSPVPGHLSIKLSPIEILVLLSWIPASKSLTLNIYSDFYVIYDVRLIYQHHSKYANFYNAPLPQCRGGAVKKSSAHAWVQIDDLTLS